MNNNQKRYFHIDIGKSTDQISALLHDAQSDHGNEINKLNQQNGIHSS